VVDPKTRLTWLLLLSVINPLSIVWTARIQMEQVNGSIAVEAFGIGQFHWMDFWAIAKGISHFWHVLLSYVLSLLLNPLSMGKTKANGSY